MACNWFLKKDVDLQMMKDGEIDSNIIKEA